MSWIEQDAEYGLDDLIPGSMFLVPGFWFLDSRFWLFNVQGMASRSAGFNVQREFIRSEQIGGELENWRTGELENWRTGELANWRIGKL